MGWLLAAQSVLHALTKDREVSEFVARALGGLPGVRSCEAQIQSSGRRPESGTPHPNGGSLRAVARTGREGHATLVGLGSSEAEAAIPAGFVPTELVMVPGQDALSIPLDTDEDRYGALTLQVHDQRLLAPYLPLVGIFASSLALLLENRCRGLRLEEANHELEQTMLELARANAELQSKSQLLEETARLGQALNRITATVSSTLVPDEVLRLVVHEGAHTLGCPRAVLKIQVEEGWIVREVFGLPESLRGRILLDDEVCVGATDGHQPDVMVVEDATTDRRVHPGNVERYGTGATLLVPVFLRNQKLGSLQFIYPTPRSFQEPEVDFVRKLGVSCALALENAALLAAERHIADALQAGLLNIPDRVGAVSCGHLYLSATDKAKVGGDFYDMFPLDSGKVAIVVGDVSGHGVEAAWVASAARDTIRAYAYVSESAEEVLSKANGALLKNQAFSGFATVFLAILDIESGRFVYCPAGHPAAMVRRSDGQVNLLSVGCAPLGVLEETVYQSFCEQLRPGDVLLVYTDGLIEARADLEFYGERRLREALEDSAGTPASGLPQVLLDRVASFCGGDFRDDVALLAVELS